VNLPLRLEVSPRSTYSLAALEGEITLLSTDAVREELHRLAENGGLVLDLSGLDFLDSAGVHLLFKTARTAREHGSSFALVCPDGSPIRRVLQIADPANTLSAHPSEAAAAETLAT
jgi:anti-anti-sigma factor